MYRVGFNFMWFIFGSLFAILGMTLVSTLIEGVEPNNFHCDVVIHAENIPDEFRNAVEFESGVWFSGSEPIGYSMDNSDDICMRERD